MPQDPIVDFATAKTGIWPMNRKGLVEAALDDALQRLGMSAWAKQQYVMPSTGQKKLLLHVMDSAQEVR